MLVILRIRHVQRASANTEFLICSKILSFFADYNTKIQYKYNIIKK